MVKELNRRHISNFSFKEADITDPESLPTGTFDITSARFLMVHMSDPISALKTIWRLTKHSGIMVVIDYDFRTHDIYPFCPEMDEFITVVDSVFEKPGLDPRIGFKLPYYFEQAGIGPPDSVEVSGFIKPVIEIRDFLLLAYRSLLSAALKLGVTTEGRVDNFVAYLQQMTENNRSYWLSALYIGVWKRKSRNI